MVVQVILDGVFAEQVCGLCGNFDGNAANDYKVCFCVFVEGGSRGDHRKQIRTPVDPSFSGSINDIYIRESSAN